GVAVLLWPRSLGWMSVVRRCGCRALELEEQLVGIAPPPVLPGLVGPDQWVVLMGVPVGGGVAVGRVVTAAHVATAHAQAQVDPAPADAKAVFAPLAGRGDVDDGVEMGAHLSHVHSSGQRSQRASSDAAPLSLMAARPESPGALQFAPTGTGPPRGPVRPGRCPMSSPPNVEPLRLRLRQALTAAMKARDAVALSALRSTLGAIDNAEAVDAIDATQIPRSKGG